MQCVQVKKSVVWEKKKRSMRACSLGGGAFSLHTTGMHVHMLIGKKQHSCVPTSMCGLYSNVRVEIVTR